MKLKGFAVLVAVAAATAAFWPAAGGAGTFRGIVVARQGGSLLAATPSGVIRAVAGRAAVGSRISLARGQATVVGHARTAHIRGIVVRRIGTTLILSSNRHLVAIRHARVPAATTPTTTAPGAVVSTTVGIANGELDEENEDQVGQVGADSIQVQAVVAAVGAGTVTLTVQGQTLMVPLPAGLTLPASVVGQTVTLSLSLAGANDDQGDDDAQGGDRGSHDGGGDG